FQVGFLVETGAELEHHRHVFAVSDGVDQRIDDLAVGRQPVAGDLDGGDIGIDGGLPQHIDQGIEGMVGEVEHDIPLEHHIGDTRRMLQQRVHERFFPVALPVENVREIHEMPKIMDTAAGDEVAALAGQVEPFEQVFQQPLIHLFVINETDGFAFAPVLQSFFNLLDQRRRDVVVDIDLRIAGNLEDPAFIGIVTEISKYIPEVEPDDVLQQDNMVLIHRGGRQDHKTAQHARRDLHDGIFPLHGVVAPREDNAEIQRFIPQIREGRDAFDHEGDRIGADLLFEIILYELLLMCIQFRFIDQVDLFVLHFFADAAPDGVELVPLFEDDGLYIVEDAFGGGLEMHVELGFA